jgi:hypothetical protein
MCPDPKKAPGASLPALFALSSTYYSVHSIAIAIINNCFSTVQDLPVENTSVVFKQQDQVTLSSFKTRCV